MPLYPIALLALALAAGCTPAEAPREPYPFVGTWNCGAATFRFTNTSYFNGSETFAIRSVARDGSNYLLYLKNGDKVALGLVTETGLTWVSGRTGDQFNCLRMN
jgi:hypothetical protein